MIICRQCDEKKERLIELFNVSAEKADKNNVPGIYWILDDEKYNCKISGFALKDKYGKTHIIGGCDKDHCIYFITDLLGIKKIIKSQLSKKEWKETVRYIIFEAYMNKEINHAFDGTPVTSMTIDNR